MTASPNIRRIPWTDRRVWLIVWSSESLLPWPPPQRSESLLFSFSSRFKFQRCFLTLRSFRLTQKFQAALLSKTLHRMGCFPVSSAKTWNRDITNNRWRHQSCRLRKPWAGGNGRSITWLKRAASTWSLATTNVGNSSSWRSTRVKAYCQLRQSWTSSIRPLATSSNGGSKTADSTAAKKTRSSA